MFYINPDVITTSTNTIAIIEISETFYRVSMTTKIYNDIQLPRLNTFQ